MAENADQPITGLPKKTVTGITANDYILGIDSAEGYQMLIQDLGNYIIQNATSSLMGSNQTIAAALTALNSNLMIVPNSPIDLPANTTSFDAFDSVITSLGAFQGKIFEVQVNMNVTLDGVTILGGRKFCQIIRHSGTDHAAIYMFGWAGQDDRYFLTKTSGTWHCSKLPSRSEITSLNNSLTPSDVYNKTGLGINVRVLKMGKLVSIIWAGTLTQSLPVGWTTIVSDLPVSYFARSPFCEFITTTNGKQYSIEITNNGAISSLRFYPRGSAIDANEFIQGTVTFFCN